MKIKNYLSLSIFALWASAVFGQLTIRLTDIPANTPPADDIYIAGDFNGWDPGNSAYILDNLAGEVF